MTRTIQNRIEFQIVPGSVTAQVLEVPFHVPSGAHLCAALEFLSKHGFSQYFSAFKMFLFVDTAFMFKKSYCLFHKALFK